MNSKLFWHVFSVAGVEAILEEQARFLRKMDPSIELEIVVTGDAGIVPQLRQLLCDQSPRITVKNASEFEFDTLQELYHQREKYDFLGYAHTKGVTSRAPNA